MFLIVGVAVVAVIILALLAGTFFIVPTSSVAVIQRFGRFQRMALPGLNVKIPLVDQVSMRLSLRVRQLDKEIETKTKDNVTVAIKVSTQYSVNPDSLESAAYRLTNPQEQIANYIYDAVRSVVPMMTLDDVFEKKNEIADQVDEIVGANMTEFGFIINRALVTDISPDSKVRDAMNEINAAERLKEAAQSKADAVKIEIVGKAMGEAEAKRLSGEGIANQRKAIAEGLAAQSKALKEAGVEDADSILMLNQYFDAITTIAEKGRTTTIMLPGTPSGVKSLTNEIREALISGNAVDSGNVGSSRIQ